MIPVTKPYLPEQAEYLKYINEIWQRHWLTNNGPLVNEYELRLKEYLGVKHLLYVTNGTIALQLAIKAYAMKGEIITTPFSYVATTSSIVWEGCRPVFVDIDENTLNINPKLIESSITSKTSAILATHCFGNACDIEAIQKIADKYNLKVIYDAAHCFGSYYNDKSIFEFGDITTLSLHATKIIHSAEGGSVITKDPEILKKLALMRNFGHNGPEVFYGVGINGKNSEFHAAMGLAVLKSADEILNRRKDQSTYYDAILKNLHVRKPEIQNGCRFNYAYYPVIFESEEKALKAKAALERQKIFPRRYFYPGLNELDYVDDFDTPVSDSISKAILCLPLYHDLSREEQHLIARVLLRTQKYGV